MEKILTYIGKVLLGTMAATLVCWNCSGGVMAPMAMAMMDESVETTIQCTNSVCESSDSTMPMSPSCASQCLMRATQGSAPTVPIEKIALPVVLVGEPFDDQIMPREKRVVEKRISPQHQRTFVIQRE